MEVISLAEALKHLAAVLVVLHAWQLLLKLLLLLHLGLYVIETKRTLWQSNKGPETQRPVLGLCGHHSTEGCLPWS